MGGSHHTVKIDPAIERWNQMREDVYKGFRFTPYTTRKVLTWAVVVPGIVGYIVYTNVYKWNWRGKLKGESLKRIQPAAPTAAAE